MAGARGVLMNITGGMDLGMLEINEAAQIVQQAADPEANIIFGAVLDESLEGRFRSRSRPRFEQQHMSDAAEPASDAMPVSREAQAPRLGLEDLDIPAFLRKR